MAALTFAMGMPTPSAPGLRICNTPTNKLSKPKSLKDPPTYSLATSMGAGVSAALLAVAGQTSRGKAQKGRKANTALCVSTDPTREIGVINPTGYWDPLNLMRVKGPTSPFKSAEDFRWYREAEIKHGRVSMIALVGLVSGTFLKWPGFEGVPSGLGALQTSEGGSGLAMFILMAGVYEFGFGKQDPKKPAGALGNNWGISGKEEKMWYTDQTRNAELAHCRLAMSAIFTAFVFEYYGVSPETYLSTKFVSPYVAFLLVPLFFSWIGGYQSKKVTTSGFSLF